MRVLASYPYQTHKPTPKGEPKVMPWIATTIISLAVAAGMMDWSDSQWVAFIGALAVAVTSVFGAIATGIVLVIRALRETNTKVDEAKKAAEQTMPASQVRELIDGK